MIKPVKRVSVADEIFEQIKQNIMSRNWLPGSKIPAETELAALSNVSRVSVRAAIQKLIVMGLLEAKQGEGTFVTDPTTTALFNMTLPKLMLHQHHDMEILEIRRCLESEAAYLAAERATEEEIEELKLILDTMVAQRAANRIDDYVQEDFNFHMLVAKASRNNLFCELMLVLKDVLYLHFAHMVKDIGIEVGYDEHRDLFNAIKNKEPQIAADITRSLINTLQQRVEQCNE
jgi:GntR family transcriptional repressor for pyruvate dehydrogenase complex